MITEKQFREAMTIVNQYCNQVPEKESTVTVSTIGCRVKLSAWGLEMQGKHLKNMVGKVVDYRPWMYPNQGTVTVKWEGVKKPDSMHESQVEQLRK